jgi:hypothetical protein
MVPILTIMASTHTAVAITAKGVIDAIQVPTKKPGAGEVLLKGMKDYFIRFLELSMNYTILFKSNMLL